MKRRLLLAGVAVVVLVGLVVGARFTVEHVVRSRVDAYFKSSAPSAKVSYDRIEVGWTDLSARVLDVRIHTPFTPPIHCDEIIIRRVEMEDDVPVDLDISTRGLVLPRALFAALAGPETKGLLDRDWVMDTDCDYTLDRKAKTFELRRLSMTMRDMLQLDMDASLAGLDYDRLLVADPAAADTLVLNRGRIACRELGLVNLIVDAVARKQNVPRDEAEQGMRAKVEQKLGEAAQSEDPLERDCAVGLRALLLDHGVMVASLEPEKPVLLKDIAALSVPEALQRLGLRVTAE